MTDKQIIIDGVDVSGCAYFGSTMFPTKNCTMDSEYLHSCESCYCYYKQLKKAMNQIVDLNKKVEAKEQECERLKKYLNQIRNEELSHLDIEWDEYETSARQEDYSNIITLVERALGEIND